MKPIYWPQRPLNEDEYQNLLRFKPELSGIVCSTKVAGDPGGYIAGFKGASLSERGEALLPALAEMNPTIKAVVALSGTRNPCRLYKHIWWFSNDTSIPGGNREIHTLTDEYIENARLNLNLIDSSLAYVSYSWLLDTEIYQRNAAGVPDPFDWRDVDRSRAIKASRIFKYRPDLYALLSDLYVKPSKYAKERVPLSGWYKFLEALKELPAEPGRTPLGLFLDIGLRFDVKKNGVGIGQYFKKAGYSPIGCAWIAWRGSPNKQKALLANLHAIYGHKISPYVYDESNYFCTSAGAKELAAICGKVR